MYTSSTYWTMSKVFSSHFHTGSVGLPNWFPGEILKSTFDVSSLCLWIIASRYDIRHILLKIITRKQWHTVSDLQRCPILLPKWYCNTILPKYTIILNLSSNSNCSEWFTKVSIGHCPILWPKLYCNTFKIIAACPNYYYSKLIFKFKCSYVASIHPPL